MCWNQKKGDIENTSNEMEEQKERKNGNTYISTPPISRGYERQKRERQKDYKYSIACTYICIDENICARASISAENIFSFWRIFSNKRVGFRCWLYHLPATAAVASHIRVQKKNMRSEWNTHGKKLCERHQRRRRRRDGVREDAATEEGKKCRVKLRKESVDRRRRRRRLVFFCTWMKFVHSFARSLSLTHSLALYIQRNSIYFLLKYFCIHAIFAVVYTTYNMDMLLYSQKVVERYTRDTQWMSFLHKNDWNLLTTLESFLMVNFWVETFVCVCVCMCRGDI